ncbi:hypothetical protein J6500_23965 [Bradyrhizobium sp. WSM 1704]|uniref:hypothetical protein n=1 Tax=Bradyrhizobium semiaridum TaxID=2821404 RepID=UPI001CE3769F|nr:hypothetical protein [Bradyrhizobium semiaridum]MCA6124925.1 hypothetical protein [Bradyrhizobium semiaridum]
MPYSVARRPVRGFSGAVGGRRSASGKNGSPAFGEASARTSAADCALMRGLVVVKRPLDVDAVDRVVDAVPAGGMRDAAMNVVGIAHDRPPFSVQSEDFNLNVARAASVPTK